MLRKILAFVGGFVTFGILVTLVQVISGLVYGMPRPETMNDPELMRGFVAGLPTGAFILLLLSYIVGSFGSGFVMRKISKWDSQLLPLAMGLIGTATWAYTITQIPHPIWVSVLGFMTYIPFTLIGHRAAR
ncbi:MAG: hypothetical protein AB7V18_11435 [Pyrinomonadaceae bacterium]